MKTASIVTAKSQFCKLIEQVKHGETIVITDRNRPVAQLQPLHCTDSTDPSLPALHASGLLRPPSASFDLQAFLAAPKAQLTQSLATAICAERQEGR